MAKRKTKKTVRITKRRSVKAKAKATAAPRGYDIHAGKPTGREVAAMHRLQPADARTRAREELRANPRKDWRVG
jgi:hypothetical protein